MPRQVVSNLVCAGILYLRGRGDLCSKCKPILLTPMTSCGHTTGTSPSTPPPLGKTLFKKAPSTYSSLLSYAGPLTQLTTLMTSGPRPSPLIKLLPLIEAARDYGPQLIDKTFSFVELKQIKADSGNYSNNPNNYIDAFQHLTLAYKLTWKDTSFLRADLIGS